MSKLNKAKKAVPEDWHRADIVAALHKAGWSLRRLSVKNNYKSPTTLIQALNRRWPKGQNIIANAIGVKPSVIWPSRYPNVSKNTTGDKAA